MNNISLFLRDTPEELTQPGATRYEEDEEEKHRQEYEEDMYIRTMLTKKDKQKIKKKQQLTDDLDTLTDFGDIASIEKHASQANDILKKKSIKDVIASLEEDEDEDDMPKTQKTQKRKVQFQEEEDLLDEDEGFDDEDSYQAPKKQRQYV
jgi:hypothetical protein